jgi:hypothetical protein
MTTNTAKIIKLPGDNPTLELMELLRERYPAAGYDELFEHFKRSLRGEFKYYREAVLTQAISEVVDDVLREHGRGDEIVERGKLT